MLLSYPVLIFTQQENPFELKKRITPKKVVQDTIFSLPKLTVTPSVPDTMLSVKIHDSAVSNPGDTNLSLITDRSADSLIMLQDSITLDSTIGTEPLEADLPADSVVNDQIDSQQYSLTPIINSSKGNPGLTSKLERLPLKDPFQIDNRNLLFGVSILILLLLASLLTVNRAIVKKAYRAIANDNYLRFLYREYKSMPWLYWLFYVHFFINAGFFTYLFMLYYDWYQGASLIVFLFCILLVMGTYILKHLLLYIIAFTFPVDKEASLYGFVTLLVNILLGLALLPLNLLVAFGPDSILPFAIWGGVSLVVLLYLFRQLKGLFISGRLVRAYLFHFFLYLCSAEIAPLLIVGKLALGNFG